MGTEESSGFNVNMEKWLFIQARLVGNKWQGEDRCSLSVEEYVQVTWGSVLELVILSARPGIVWEGRGGRWE